MRYHQISHPDLGSVSLTISRGEIEFAHADHQKRELSPVEYRDVEKKIASGDVDLGSGTSLIAKGIVNLCQMTPETVKEKESGPSPAMRAGE